MPFNVQVSSRASGVPSQAALEVLSQTQSLVRPDMAVQKQLVKQQHNAVLHADFVQVNEQRRQSTFAFQRMSAKQLLLTAANEEIALAKFAATQPAIPAEVGRAHVQHVSNHWKQTMLDFDQYTNASLASWNQYYATVINDPAAAAQTAIPASYAPVEIISALGIWFREPTSSGIPVCMPFRPAMWLVLADGCSYVPVSHFNATTFVADQRTAAQQLRLAALAAPMNLTVLELPPLAESSSSETSPLPEVPKNSSEFSLFSADDEDGVLTSDDEASCDNSCDISPSPAENVLSLPGLDEMTLPTSTPVV